MSTGIDRFTALIPPALHAESGKVFYSGRAAFDDCSAMPIYVLGVDPGGDPTRYPAETVEHHTRNVVNNLSPEWSAYRDEVWEGAPPGTHGMAPRILHLFRQLALQPGLVPASNLFFVRSRREENIKERQVALADACWPFHAAVIEKLRPRVVLCLGGTAGDYVRKKLSATHVQSQFVEQNNRRWKSQIFSAPSGIRVVVATHPSIADWSVPGTNPSNLVREAFHEYQGAARDVRDARR